MITKFKRAVTYDEENTILWPCNHVRPREKLKAWYLLVQKTYDQENLSIVSQDSLVTQSREVTRQTKNEISSLAQHLWPPNLVGWWLIMTHNAGCSCDHIRSRDKLKTKYLLLSKGYDHQTWQTDNFGERNPSMESHDPLKTWWCVVTWQIKRVKCSLSEDLWPWNLASWWLIVRWTQPWSHSSFWSPGHMRSCHKLKLKYFFLQKTCGHQNLQSGDISGDQVHNEIAWLWSRNHKMSRVKL